MKPQAGLPSEARHLQQYKEDNLTLNPFPGMNPYLEDPTLWRGVHNNLNTYFSAQLNRALPSAFVARVEERVYVVQDERDIYPDFSIYRRPDVPVRPVSGGGTATLVRPSPGFSVHVEPAEVRERFIEIREARNDHVVTVIEIISPANKANPAGREAYWRKQSEVLNSDVHLLEIDLLRSGPYILAVPENRVRNVAPRWDYLFCLHRGTERYRYTFWPVTVRERLPIVPVPLTEEAGEVSFDIQESINRLYDEGAFDRSLHYNEEPVPPLEGDDADWLDTLLKEKGLRQ